MLKNQVIWPREFWSNISRNKLFPNIQFSMKIRGEKDFHIQERKKHINDLDFSHWGHCYGPMSQSWDLRVYYKEPGELWIIPELFIKINV